MRRLFRYTQTTAGRSGRFFIALMLSMPILAGLLFGCGEDRWPEYYPYTGRNLWIDSVLRQEYLWAEQLPASEKLTSYYFGTPEAFLRNALPSIDNSNSYVDTLRDVPEPAPGYTLSLYKVSGNDTAMQAVMTYVEPNSVAGQAGLQRGEWIMQLDGDNFTSSTASKLTDGESHQLLIGKYQTVTDDDGETTQAIVSDRLVTLPAATSFKAADIPAYNIIESNGQQIGYLAYNRFSADNIAQLLTLSNTFQQAGITQFVLDLRYCSQGDIETLPVLASILAPAAQMGYVLAMLEYNDRQRAKNHELSLGTEHISGGSNLNLSQLYVLTSTSTKGIAEILINCLSPYMDITVVGQTTAGSNVATGTFTNPVYRYELHPAVCYVYNGEGTASYAGSGFTPTTTIDGLADFATLLPLGDPDETLLSAAIALMNAEE